MTHRFRMCPLKKFWTVWPKQHAVWCHEQAESKKRTKYKVRFIKPDQIFDPRHFHMINAHGLCVTIDIPSSPFAPPDVPVPTSLHAMFTSVSVSTTGLLIIPTARYMMLCVSSLLSCITWCYLCPPHMAARQNSRCKITIRAIRMWRCLESADSGGRLRRERSRSKRRPRSPRH